MRKQGSVWVDEQQESQENLSGRAYGRMFNNFQGVDPFVERTACSSTEVPAAFRTPVRCQQGRFHYEPLASAFIPDGVSASFSGPFNSFSGPFNFKEHVQPLIRQFQQEFLDDGLNITPPTQSSSSSSSSPGQIQGPPLNRLLVLPGQIQG